jgi:hypothetical protein
MTHRQKKETLLPNLDGCCIFSFEKPAFARGFGMVKICLIEMTLSHQSANFYTHSFF